MYHYLARDNFAGKLSMLPASVGSVLVDERIVKKKHPPIFPLPAWLSPRSPTRS